MEDKKEKDYKELSYKLLEGLCIITTEFFDFKLRHGKMKIDDELDLPLDLLRNMWVADYISKKTEIDIETLTELACEEEEQS